MDRIATQGGSDWKSVVHGFLPPWKATANGLRGIYSCYYKVGGRCFQFQCRPPLVVFIDSFPLSHRGNVDHFAFQWRCKCKYHVRGLVWSPFVFVSQLVMKNIKLTMRWPLCVRCGLGGVLPFLAQLFLRGKPPSIAVCGTRQFSKLKTCLPKILSPRVAKCHEYGGYIRVKKWKVGEKSLGEYTVLQIQPLFWVYLSNYYEILSPNQDYIIECSAFVIILFLWGAKFVAIYALFLG